jgi:hypothetical protein
MTIKPHPRSSLEPIRKAKRNVEHPQNGITAEPAHSGNVSRVVNWESKCKPTWMANNQNNVKLHGFGIADFRSFGPTTQFLGPFKKTTVIIGENNSGKSNITRYVAGPIGEYFSNKTPKFSEIDRPTSAVQYPPRHFWLLLKTDQESALFKRLGSVTESRFDALLQSFTSHIKCSAPDLRPNYDPVLGRVSAS